jgi:hypothetical protein
MLELRDRKAQTDEPEYLVKLLFLPPGFWTFTMT